MKNEIPFCYGEFMQATYRYKDNGVIYRTFTCMHCNRKEEVEWDD